MTTAQLLVAPAVAVPAGIVIWAIITMNRLTAFRSVIRDAWLDCEITLKKRHVLAGILADAIESEAPEESNCTAAVLGARSQAMVDTKNFANLLSREKVLASTMNALLERMEMNPELRQNLTLIAKVQELVGNESRIADDQRAYNARVHEYNVACSSFPSSMVARLGGLKAIPFLDLPIIEGLPSLRASSYSPGDTAVFG